MRVQYGSSSKTNEDSDGITVLRMGNLFEGNLLLDKLKYLPKSHDEFPELLLEPDDLLFNRTNSPELVGKTAVYKGKPYPCSFASYLIRARFINGVDPNFICYFINSNYGRQWIKSVVSQQVGQANVNGTKLQALFVPLPPHNEQGIIVSEVENKFSIIDGIEKEVDRNLIRADRLRQSVLKKAFSGKLIQSMEI
jgi:type I restriction enzyme S subunit